MLTLIIYEDKDNLRESLRLMLNGMDDVEVAASFSNCNTVEEDIRQLKPDVVLMDIDMPGRNGIYGVEKIKEINPAINVIMHTVFDDDDKIFKSLEAGADGYLLKTTSPEKLYEAIKDVTLGSAPISNNSNSAATVNINNASLQQNVPNPFKGITTISYNLPQQFSIAQIIIRDINGKQLKQISITQHGSGKVHVDAATLSAGAYSYSLIIDGKLLDTKQMIAVK